MNRARNSLVGFAVLIVAMGTHAQTATSTVTVTGYLTDTLCGARGANHLHAEHARRSVASGKAQYAIYDEQSRQLYILESGPGAGSSAQAGIEAWLGQRVRITGTVGATPLRRAGQSYAPDAVATVEVNGVQRPVSGNASRTGTAPGTPLSTGAASSAPTPRVQQHEKALDTATPVAGVLAIASIEPATAAPANRKAAPR